MGGALNRGWKRIAGAAALAGAITVTSSVFTPGVTADSSGDIRVRFGGDRSETRVVIDLNQPVTGRLLASGNQQVVLLLQHVDANAELTGAGRGLVNGWSLRRDLSGVRVQLDLAQSVTVRRRFLLPPADGVSGYRYVVDLSASQATAATSQPLALRPRETTEARDRAAPTNLTPPPETRQPDEAPRRPVDDAAFTAALREALASAPPPPVTRRLNVRHVVVIDAGHGGNDPGASGVTSHESDVTLAAARVLRRRLEATGRYRVVMTRSSDNYVSLQNRVRISRRAGADLFISLHADAVADPTRRGASVYTLSDQGGRRVTRVLGRNEWFLRADTAVADRSVGRILLDLTQRSTRNRSADFAQQIVEHISDRTVVLPRTHRDANYFVLLAPDVPAVLLEMGFITNPMDEAALRDPRHREALMDAVADAIDGFFAEETTLAMR